MDQSGDGPTGASACLSVVAERLEALVHRSQEPSVRKVLDDTQAAAEEVGKAWSGSFLGYHATVYYAALTVPPAGAHFSPEWGLRDTFADGTVGDWMEFRPEDVESAIQVAAGNPDLISLYALRDEMAVEFDGAQLEMLSILEPWKVDAFVERLYDRLDKMAVVGPARVLRTMLPRGQIMSRDSKAVTQGMRKPPHLSVLADILSIRDAIDKTAELSRLSRQAQRHFSRQGRSDASGTSVFVGHGRSPVWRELKDFLTERLQLDVDEFNRVPVAGVTNTARLSELMDSATMALIVMTAEDEQADGTFHARLNAVHEVGLFQGRLGFHRTIVVLEEGCEGFSNIQGLGHIGFPKAEIGAAFEKIRHALEREGVVRPAVSDNVQPSKTL
ncbi:MAG: hypothetical protein F4Y01_03450 [Gammaproteobacteria bacterium]|nr:hypothetical protein [Gammaproteobacteria bacterium]